MGTLHGLRMGASAVEVVQANDKMKEFMRDDFMTAVIIGIKEAGTKRNAFSWIVWKIYMGELGAGSVDQEGSSRQSICPDHWLELIRDIPEIAIQNYEELPLQCHNYAIIFIWHTGFEIILQPLNLEVSLCESSQPPQVGCIYN